jgi:nucleotidyltransferase/DNA polymerase involved in DNA repair
MPEGMIAHVPLALPETGPPQQIAYVALGQLGYRGEACCPAPLGADWLRVCYQVTDRVQQISARAAFLDLGSCAPAEALLVLRQLRDRLTLATGCLVRIGGGPSLSLAQLALFWPRLPGAGTGRAGARGRGGGAAGVVYLPTADMPAFVRGVPVRLLPALHPQGLVDAMIVTQLERYGLLTLGHVARLSTAQLARHFGASVGRFLAAVATGRDTRPLCPTPPPPMLRLRLRCCSALTPEQVLMTVLPRLAQHAERALGGRGAQRLALGLRSECSGEWHEQVLVVRRAPTEAGIEELTRTLQWLAEPLLRSMTPTPGTSIDQADQRVQVDERGIQVALQVDDQVVQGSHTSDERIDAVRLTLSDFISNTPRQTTLWCTPAQSRSAALEVANQLKRRYGQPLLVAPHVQAPAAIFPEDRFHLRALGSTADEEEAERAFPAPLEMTAVWPERPPQVHWW